MIAKNRRKRNLGWIAGVVLATTVGVAGCSNDSGSSAKEKEAGRGSNVADPKEKDDKDDKNGKEEANAGGGTGDPTAPQDSEVPGQATAEGAVAAWVAAVIKGQPKEACLLMGQSGTDSAPARASTPAMCEGETPEAREMQDNLKMIRTSFIPDPPTEDPKVEVAPVPSAGDKTVVPADKVVVDGQTLHNIILSNSTGVESEQLDVTMESTKIGTAWYVTNLDLGVG